MKKQWRQGDVLFEEVPDTVSGVERRGDATLYVGEATGHRHRIEDPATAEILVPSGGPEWGIFLRVHEPGATIVHEEHRPLRLDPGFYRVWRQREYVPGGTRGIAD